MLPAVVSPGAQGQGLQAVEAEKPLPHAFWAETLDLRNMSVGYGQARAARTVDNHSLSIGHVAFPHGIGTHAPSQMQIDLKGVALRFLAAVGVDDEVQKNGSVVFNLYVDGKQTATSGPMEGGDPAKLLSVDLKGAKRLLLEVTPANGNMTYGHGDWGGAMIVLSPNPGTWPQSVNPKVETIVHRFPPILETGMAPEIHGPQIVGATPHHPFLFLIPATGRAPLIYSASPLPKGLILDPHRGIITGQVPDAGDYRINLTVSCPGGKTSRTLELVSGAHKLALTPPMGWNAWNVYGETVTAEKIREQARWMVKSGLAAHGFQYIIIDDTWQGRRDDAGNLSASNRFGDMASLARYVHSLGLKLGLLSSPTEQTCSGYAGSAGHEVEDAKAFATWGIDYLKYDWCQQNENKSDVTNLELKTGFQKMRDGLDQADRDIVFSINPYGLGNVWEWASQVGANTWRSTGEILDKWDSIQAAGFTQLDHDRQTGPGHWNDLGWLMIGRLGSSSPHFPHLSMDEQMSQLTLWCMLSSPLILSCDLTQLNPNNFYPSTTSLLTNDEVLEIDQDALGQPAHRLGWSDSNVVLTRPLADGTVAVALLNKQFWPQTVSIKWSDLGLSGSQPVRDCWQHKDLGLFSETYTAAIPRHGVVLLKIGRPHAGTNTGTLASQTSTASTPIH